MSEVSKLITRVRRFVSKRGHSKYSLALRAGLTQNALRDCDKPKWNPSAGTLDKLARTMDAIEAEEAEEKATGRLVAPATADAS